MPLVVKRDDSREPFDEAKLRCGMVQGAGEAPGEREAVEEALARIGHRLRSMGEREVQSRVIGELVMEELRAPGRGRLRALRLGVPQLPGRRVLPGEIRQLRELGDRTGGGTSCPCCRTSLEHAEAEFPR